MCESSQSAQVFAFHAGLVYQQHQHSDFLRQCAQDSTIQDHLSEVKLTKPAYVC